MRIPPRPDIHYGLMWRLVIAPLSMTSRDHRLLPALPSNPTSDVRWYSHLFEWGDRTSAGPLRVNTFRA
jgi:hypothetical protein